MRSSAFPSGLLASVTGLNRYTQPSPSQTACAPGTVIEDVPQWADYRTQRFTDVGYTYYPVVQFSDSLGRQHTFKNPVGRSNATVLGTVVRVYYDPNNPDDAVIPELNTMELPSLRSGLLPPGTTLHDQFQAMFTPTNMRLSIYFLLLFVTWSLVMRFAPGTPLDLFPMLASVLWLILLRCSGIPNLFGAFTGIGNKADVPPPPPPPRSNVSIPTQPLP